MVGGAQASSGGVSTADAAHPGSLLGLDPVLAAGAAADGLSVGWPEFTEWLQNVATSAGRELAVALGFGYEHAPALLLGLSLIAAVPALMIAGLIVRRSSVAAGPERTRRLRAAAAGGAEAEVAERPTHALPRRPPPRRAALIAREGDNHVVGEFEIAETGIVRIGREDDNEIRLRHPTVHRYHALLARSPELGFVVTDLSSPGGNGVTVNGRRVAEASLAHGDVIGVGAARLEVRMR